MDFLGILAYDEDNTSQIDTMMKDVLLKMKKAVSKTGEEEWPDLDKFLYTYWHWPIHNYHITSHFNHDPEVFNTISRKFTEDLMADINIRAIVYVENYLICGLCFPVDIDCENKFPHITLYLY